MKQRGKLGFGKRALSLALALVLAATYASMTVLTEDVSGVRRADSTQSEGDRPESGGGETSSNTDTFEDGLPEEELSDKTVTDSGVKDSGTCICLYKCVILNPACPVCAKDFSLCKGSAILPRSTKIHTKPIDFADTLVTDVDHPYDPCWEHTLGTGSTPSTVVLRGFTLITDNPYQHALYFVEPTNLILAEGSKNTVSVISSDYTEENIGFAALVFNGLSNMIDGNGSLDIYVKNTLQSNSHTNAPNINGIYFPDGGLDIGNTGSPNIKIEVADSKITNIQLFGIRGANSRNRDEGLKINGGNLNITVGVTPSGIRDSNGINVNGAIEFNAGTTVVKSYAGAVYSMFAKVKIAPNVLILGTTTANAPTEEINRPAQSDAYQITLVSDRFEAANCAILKKTPSFIVADQAGTLTYGDVASKATFGIFANNLSDPDATFEVKWVNKARAAVPQPNGLLLEFNDLNSQITIQPGTADAGEYYFTLIMKSKGVTYTSDPKTVTVSKANYPGTILIPQVAILENLDVVQEGTVSMSEFFVTAPRGTKITGITPPSSQRLLESTPVIQNGTLKYTSKKNVVSSATMVEDSYTVTLQSDNYEDISAQLIFFQQKKFPLTISGVQMDIDSPYKAAPVTLRENDPKAYATNGGLVNATFTYSYQQIDGTPAVSGASATTPPTNAGRYILTVTATTSDSYGKKEIPFTISPIPLSVKPVDQRAFRLNPLPTPELSFTGFTGADDQSKLTAIYRGVHTVANAGEVGAYPIKLEVVGTEKNGNYTVTSGGDGTLTVLESKFNTVSPTPPTGPINIPFVQGSSLLPYGMGMRYLFADISNTSTAAMQMISQLKNTSNNSVFAIYDVELQKGVITDSIWQSVDVATDLKDGKAILHLPVPAGTSPNTYNYTIYHFVNGADKPPIALSTAVNANSVYAPATSFSPFVLVSTPKGGGGGGGGGGGSGGGSSSVSTEYSFWQNVKQKVERAKADDVIKVSAKSYSRMPWNVMEALYQKKSVGMVITWNGGDSITIPAGKAQKKESSRVYWPLSLLAKLYAGIGEETLLKTDDSQTASNPTLGDSELGGHKVIPITGGGLILVDAPETEVLYSGLTQPVTSPTREVASELSGFDRESFPGVPSPDLSAETAASTPEKAQQTRSALLAVCAAAAMILAALASTILLVKNYKRQRERYLDL